MKEELITNIINGMMESLDESGIKKLKACLFIAFNDYEVSKKKNELATNDDCDYILIRKFCDAKMAAGKSEKTIKQYMSSLKTAILFINKNILDMTEDDIRYFLYRYQEERHNSSTTVRNMRAYLSSFFGWLRKNRYIIENPMDLVEPVKQTKIIKKPYNDEEMTILKDACVDKRDRAIVDFLDASLIRVGELHKLNREDIMFTDRECIVFGKGKKERTVYFNGEAKVHLQQYLESRKDNNPALFVSKRGSNRLGISGIESALKRLGKKAGIKKVHPHRFRRTGATRCLGSGMPIEELQLLMGHQDIKTTLIYGRVDQKKVKFRYDSICSW